MSPHVTNTKCIDIVCEPCNAPIGTKCYGGVFCSWRRRRAADLTRKANAEWRMQMAQRARNPTQDTNDGDDSG